MTSHPRGQTIDALDLARRWSLAGAGALGNTLLRFGSWARAGAFDVDGQTGFLDAHDWPMDGQNAARALWWHRVDPSGALVDAGCSDSPRTVQRPFLLLSALAAFCHRYGLPDPILDPVSSPDVQATLPALGGQDVAPLAITLEALDYFAEGIEGGYLRVHAEDVAAALKVARADAWSARESRGEEAPFQEYLALKARLETIRARLSQMEAAPGMESSAMPMVREAVALRPIEPGRLAHFLKRDSWALVEAIFLLKGYDPPGEENVHMLLDHAELHDLYALVVSAIEAGTLCREVQRAGVKRFIEAPKRWVEWALAKEIVVSTALLPDLAPSAGAGSVGAGSAGPDRAERRVPRGRLVPLYAVAMAWHQSGARLGEPPGRTLLKAFWLNELTDPETGEPLTVVTGQPFRSFTHPDRSWLGTPFGRARMINEVFGTLTAYPRWGAWAEDGIDPAASAMLRRKNAEGVMAGSDMDAACLTLSECPIHLLTRTAREYLRTVAIGADDLADWFERRGLAMPDLVAQRLGLIPPGRLPRAARKKAASRIGAETRCRKWLEELMREGPKQGSKADYRSNASNRFQVGERAFNRAWDAAIANTKAAGWKAAGRPKKS